MLSPIVAHNVYVGVIEKMALIPNSGTVHYNDNGDRTIVYNTENDIDDGDIEPNGQVAIRDSDIGQPHDKKNFIQSIKGKPGYDLRAKLEKTPNHDFGKLKNNNMNIVGETTFDHVPADPNDKFHPDNRHIYHGEPEPLKYEQYGNIAGHTKVDTGHEEKGNMGDMYDAAELSVENTVDEDPQYRMHVVPNENQSGDGTAIWNGRNNWHERSRNRLDGNIYNYVNEEHHDMLEMAEPMNITFQLLKAKSYIQDRPKRLAQAKVQRLSRKVKNARTQHKYKRNLARGAIRPKMRTQTGLIRVTRSR